MIELNDHEYTQAPFPYFGGKSTIAEIIWQRFGAIQNYIEPFFGSGAVLLKAPEDENRTETVNDLNGFIANFWRAIKADPEQTAHYADYPVFECDLHARHIWLVNQSESLVERLEGDPDYYDPKIAGWWCWGMCCWIGGNFCAGTGPWVRVEDEEGYKVLRDEGKGGVNRQLVHLGNKGSISRRLVHLIHFGMGITSKNKRNKIYDWFEYLSQRFRRVRVCSGDWSRVMGPTITIKNGLTGIFFDPPYTDKAGRDKVYSNDSFSVGHDVYKYCIKNGDNPMLRIALCGYEGEYDFPDTWKKVEWKAVGGYALKKHDKSNMNKHKERIWFNPHCLAESQGKLF